MQAAGKNPAAIVSKRIIASHQISSILQRHGWTPHILDGNTCPDDIHSLRPQVLVADIDDCACNGLNILKWFRQCNPRPYSVALCAGGCSPAMRWARHLGVDGFLYLNASGLSLDPKRGLMPFIMQQDHAALTPARPFIPPVEAQPQETFSPGY